MTDQPPPQGDTFNGDYAFKVNTNAGNIVYNRNEAPAPIATSLHQLPSPPIDFTGRTAELAELLSNIEHGAIITGLRGMGGIGKTALALVLADKLKGTYPDAQFYLDLRGASDKPMPPIEAMQHVIRGYHPTAKLPDDPTDIAALYRSVLDGQRALLLMDNAKDADQIKPLLPPASCLTLITSRQKFYVTGIQTQDLDTLQLDDASKLLIRIAPRLSNVILSEAKDLAQLTEILRRKSAAQNDTQIMAVDALAYFCGYLPLALQVSASTLAERADLQPQEFIRRLSDTQQRLQLTGVDASLQLSYDLLTPELKQTFSQLAVFPASFDAAAEEAVCEDADHLRLSELVRLSLVQYDNTMQRYQLHDLVRLFADKRPNDKDRIVAQYRHSEHYLIVLSTANDFYLKGSDFFTLGLRLFDLEQSNIRAGQNWSNEHGGESESLAQLCSNYAGTGSLLGLRLHPYERIRWIQSGLEGSRLAHNRNDEGVHLSNLANAYADLGETRKAIEYHEQALKIDREIGDQSGEGRELGNLGSVYYTLGETRKAIEVYEQRIRIAREISDRRGESSGLGNLGLAYADLGETRRAIEFYEQALKMMQEMGDIRAEGSILCNLGLAYADLGETRRAIEFYEQALKMMQEIGDKPAEGSVLGNLGNAYANLGETRKAIEYHEKGLKLDREIGYRRGEGRDLGNLGSAYGNLGETSKAIEFYEQALTVMHEIGDRRGEGNTLFNMSLALDDLGERVKALELAEAALKILKQIEDPRTEVVRKQLAEWKGEKGRK
jgi:tetratricopeptide (TPR) repeat protein